MNIIEFEKLYETRGERRGGILLFSKEVACEFINDVKKNGFKLLGVESFKVSKAHIQPVQDFSNDESSHKGSQNDFIEITKALIASADNDIKFEVVISE